MSEQWKTIDAAAAEASWSRSNWMERARGGERIDPRMVWADTTRFADLGKPLPEWCPVALELEGTTAAEFERQMRRFPEWILVPQVYASSPGDGLAEATFCTALVHREFIARTAPLGAEVYGMVKRLELDLPVATERELRHGSNPLALNSKVERAPPCIAGVIDHGIAFAHSRFRVPGSTRTRIEHFWNQDIARLPSGVPAVPNSVPGLGYGRELARGDIDARLLAYTSGGLVDEERLYRLAAHEGVGGRLAHGTHVMDLACGADQADDPMAGVPIVAVQLPWSTTQDTSGGALAVHVLNGLRYILDRADRIAGEAGKLPVVVNMSYGNLAGPHDGTSILEAAVDEIVRLRSAVAPLSVVVPSGNSHLSRCHARCEVGAHETVNLPAWRILPDDATPSFMEIWLPRGAQEIAIEVTSPTGQRSGPIRYGEARVWKPDASVLCTVVVLEHNARGDSPMAFVAIEPTVSHIPGRAVAPCGDWRIAVANEGQENVVVHAWIQRDDPLPGSRMRGRQSRFEDSKYERFEHPSGRIQQADNASVARRAGSMSAIATGFAPVVVGGFRRSDATAAPYSAGGDMPARTGSDPIPAGEDSLGRTGPDLMAVSEASSSCAGVLAAGSRSGTVVAMRGTSVAAPQVARELILDHLPAPGATGSSATAVPTPGENPAAAVARARLRAAELVRGELRAPKPSIGTGHGAQATIPQQRGGAGLLRARPGRVPRRETD